MPRRAAFTLHIDAGAGDHGGFAVGLLDALAELVGAAIVEFAAHQQRLFQQAHEAYFGVWRARWRRPRQTRDQGRGVRRCRVRRWSGWRRVRRQQRERQ